MNKFKIGDKVKVIKFLKNASTFFNRHIHTSQYGVYQFDNWRKLVFEICRDPKLYKGSEIAKDELCYPVSLGGKEIGYVYESGLELVQKKGGYIYIKESDENWTNGKIYYLNPGKSINDINAFTDDHGYLHGWYPNNFKFFKPVNDIEEEPGQMQLNLKIKKAILLLTDGTDVIRLTLDAPSSFPKMNYDSVMTMECQQGYGETYCKEVLGLAPEIINLRTK